MARAMKDSGVEWIGEIPEGWEKCRLRYICTIQTGNQDTQDRAPAGVYPFYVRSPLVERSNKYTFDGESILMAGDGVGAGKVFHLAHGKFACHQRVYCLQGFRDTYRPFLFFYLQSLFFHRLEEINAKSTVDSVRLPMLQDFPIFKGSYDEQQRIADFLDTATADIDASIAKTRESIEEYKKLKQAVITQAVTKGIRPGRAMKDSGVEWIGEIPEVWNLLRIKNCISPLKREILPSDGVVTCFRDGQVTLRANRREDGFTISFLENGYQGVEANDLVIHGLDAFAGAIGCSDSRGKCSPVVHVCSTTGCNRFFMHTLRSMALNDVLAKYASGVRIRSSDFRNFQKLGVFPIPVPPCTEQQEIAAYLDEKCGAIDNLIEKKQAIITELEAYKKSLIYEYVTGKKEIPAGA